jgi:hypothetical protein
MSVFKNGKFYHFEFQLDGRRHRGSTGTASKPQAIAEERRQRERLAHFPHLWRKMCVLSVG